VKYLVGESDSSSKESIYMVLNKGKQIKENNEEYKRIIPSPGEVSIRRGNQLRRFFPVLLTRLKHNKSFLKAKDQLLKYSEWQIIQAACNLYAKNNWPEHGKGKNVNMTGIYQALRSSAQDANEDAMITFVFDVGSIEKQILHDMKYLHDNVCPNSKNNMIRELSNKGYI
jgi:hypothetical protein